MDVLNTEKVSTKECRDLAVKISALAERAGSKLQLERAGHLVRAAKVLHKAAETED